MMKFALLFCLLLVNPSCVEPQERVPDIFLTQYFRAVKAGDHRKVLDGYHPLAYDVIKFRYPELSNVNEIKEQIRSELSDPKYRKVQEDFSFQFDSTTLIHEFQFEQSQVQLISFQ